MRKLLSKHITAVALSAALFLAASPCTMTAQAAGTRFADVPNGAWYTPAVTYVVENGLFAGNGNGTFSPEGSMTRAMFVTVLAKIAEANVSSAPDAGFMDVPQNWYTDYVNWAFDNGYVAGTSDTTFEPNKAINRQQIAVILRNYLQIENISLPPASDAVSSFKDAAQVDSWAEQAVDVVRSLGLMAGDDEGYFHPAQNLTRAEAASVFMKFDMKLKGITEQEPEGSEIQDALVSHPWNASVQSLDCYQFFADGTGINLYGTPIPAVVPFTCAIDERNCTVKISFGDSARNVPTWNYSSALQSFSLFFTEAPGGQQVSFQLRSGNMGEEFASAAEYCEAEWERTVSETANVHLLGNSVDTMKTLMERIVQYLGYVLPPEEFAQLNRQLASWEQDLQAEMESVEWVGSISRLTRLSINKEWTIKKIYELIEMIP